MEDKDVDFTLCPYCGVRHEGPLSTAGMRWQLVFLVSVAVFVVSGLLWAGATWLDAFFVGTRVAADVASIAFGLGVVSKWMARRARRASEQ